MGAISPTRHLEPSSFFPLWLFISNDIRRREEARLSLVPFVSAKCRIFCHTDGIKKKKKKRRKRKQRKKIQEKKSLPRHIKSGLTLLLLKRLSSVKNGVLAVSDVAAFYSHPFNRDSTRFNEENWEFFLQRGIPRYFFLSPSSILTSE